MAFVIKLLGAGPTNAGSLTVPYSVSSPATAAIVNNLRFVNTSTAAGTINLFFNPSGAVGQVRILEKDKPIAAGDILVVKQELTMVVGDAIEVTTSVAMEYVVCGMQKE